MDIKKKKVQSKGNKYKMKYSLEIISNESHPSPMSFNLPKIDFYLNKYDINYIINQLLIDKEDGYSYHLAE
jgi:hypothetical protein